MELASAVFAAGSKGLHAAGRELGMCCSGPCATRCWRGDARLIILQAACYVFANASGGQADLSQRAPLIVWMLSNGRTEA